MRLASGSDVPANLRARPQQYPLITHNSARKEDLADIVLAEGSNTLSESV